MKDIKVIKYEGLNNIFVYKYPEEDFEIGTQLIVHQSQVAVFYYNGQAMETYSPGEHTLETARLPKVKFFKQNNVEMFHSEVYFVNKTIQSNIKWGTPNKIIVNLPKEDLTISFGAYGTFNIRVDQERRLLDLVVGNEKIFGQFDLTAENTSPSSITLQGFFRDLIISRFSSYIASEIINATFDIRNFDAYKNEIGNKFVPIINEDFIKYGFKIENFFISNVSFTQDANYLAYIDQLNKRSEAIRLQRIDKDVSIEEKRKELELQELENQLALKKAEGARNVSNTYVDAEAYKTQTIGVAEANVMKAKGYTYQDETKRQVATTFAENQGSSTQGSSILSDVAGVGVGLAVGKEVISQAMDVLKDDPKKEEAPSGQWVCPNCGSINTTLFCPNCGKKKE